MSGKEFQVIKTRKVGGSLTLVLQDNEQGSFAVPADWTDYFPADLDAQTTSDAFIAV